MATEILEIGLSQQVPMMLWKPVRLDPAPSLPVSLSAQIRGQDPLCDGHSSDCHAPALSSSLDLAHPVCLMVPSGVDPLRMLRGWFCLCSCSRMGFCLLRSRNMGQMCIEVMHVLRNTQAFKDAFKVSPFHCWDTDVLLVQILFSPYSSSCAYRSVISREANVSAVLVKAVFLKGGGLCSLAPSASISSPLHSSSSLWPTGDSQTEF